MVSALVVLALASASAIVLSACTSSSKGFDKHTFYLEEKIPGESLSLHCFTQKRQEQFALYKANKLSKTNIMHVFEDDKAYDVKYKNRVKLTKHLNNLSIIITNLTEEDSGIYYCQYSKIEVDGEVNKTVANEVVALFVKQPAVLGQEPHTGPTPTLSSNSNSNSTTSFILALFSIFTAVVVFLMFSIMLVFYVIPKIKTLRAPQAAQNRGNDSVYEVMSATLKRT